MGLLDSLPGGGLLGPGMQNFGTGLLSYFQQNPATIAALAAGIGSAPSMRQGLAAAAGGMPQAMQADQTRQGQQALGQYFKDPSNAQGLTPGQMQLLSKYPALAEKYALQAMLPGQTDDLKEYQYAKSQGYTGTFQDYMVKVKGASGAQESSFGTFTPLYDNQTNAMVGGFTTTNRGTVIQYKVNPSTGTMEYAGESRAPSMSPGTSPGAPVAMPQGGAPQTPAPVQAPGNPSGSPAASGAAAPQTPATTPSIGYRPPGSSVKLAPQGTSIGVLTGSGQPVGSLPVFNAQESADKTAGVDQAADLKTVNNNSLKATTQKNSIALMRQASQDKNFYSGFAADPVLAAKKMAIALGADPALAASMENFQSMSNQLVKDRLGSLGTGVSNADVGFISRTVPTLEATPQGNQQLLDILDKLADRDIEVARVAQDYAKKNGGGTRLDANWSSYLADWAQSHPLFSGGGSGSGLPPGVTVERIN